MAELLDLLVTSYGLNLDDVTIIGHSLGAHIAGRTGKFLKAHWMHKIGCIVGLDPAGVGFDFLKPEKRLDSKDAKSFTRTANNLECHRPLDMVICTLASKENSLYNNFIERNIFCS